MSEEIKNRKQSNKKKLFASIVTVLVVVALIAGLTYAWFVRQTDMATLMAITPPSGIAILGPDGKEMDSLDLNYSEGDKKGNTVTVKRVICVQSGESVSQYKLEIVHTTNLKGLTFKLYPVSENGTSDDLKVTEDGKTYNYSSESLVTGKYLNLESDLSPTSEYKDADETKHKQNYNDYDKVQAHAEPLYWLVDAPLSPSTKHQVTLKNSVTNEEEKYNRTYYVCEVSWTETTKETDIFYILAETA